MPEQQSGSKLPRTFSEPGLVESLNGLSFRGRSTFACACSVRLYPGYIKWCKDVGTPPADYIREMVQRIKVDLRSGKDDEIYPNYLDEIENILSFMPDEDSEWSLALPIAEDAVACLAYTARSMITGMAQEAAWAARRAYEAADQLAINDVRQESLMPSSESKLLSHLAVQTELRRQDEDYRLILEGKLDAVLNRTAFPSIYDYQA